MDIASIDKNFKLETELDLPDVCFYNVKEAPFAVYGVFYENGIFRRMPGAVAKTVSDGVVNLHARTAGGRVRFLTDSPYVAISAKMPCVAKMSHFPLTGSSGFDLYVGDRYTASLPPPFTISHGYERAVRFPTAEGPSFTF